MAKIVTGSFAKEIDRYAIEICGIPSLDLMERAAASAAEAVRKQAEKRMGSQEAARVLICCGVGNNGADGLCTAAILKSQGFQHLHVLCCGREEKASEEFLYQQRRLRSLGLREQFVTEEFFETFECTQKTCDIIVDALFGIGLRREVSGLQAKLIELMNLIRNKSGAYLISVDMPSGIDADFGENMCGALYPVQADETVSFGYAKTGMYLGYGFGHCGSIHIADIGYPEDAAEKTAYFLKEKDAADKRAAEKRAASVDAEKRKASADIEKGKASAEADIGEGGFSGRLCSFYETSDSSLSLYQEALQLRDEAANKGSYGKLLIVAGSEGMAGAAYLSGLSAYRAGAGMVKFLGPKTNRSILQTLLPEAMYASYEPASPDFKKDLEQELRAGIQWADTIILGPGLSQADYTKELMQTVCEQFQRLDKAERPYLIIDADALNLIAKEDACRVLYGEKTVITPHVGEMARLLGKPLSEVKKRLPLAAEQYAREQQVHVLLKDAVSAVAVWEEAFDRKAVRTYLNLSGHAAMAKAGSGDVLTGVLAGLIFIVTKDGGSLSDAVLLSVYLHGLAGSIAAEEKGSHGTLARDLANCIPLAMKRAAENTE